MSNADCYIILNVFAAERAALIDRRLRPIGSDQIGQRYGRQIPLSRSISGDLGACASFLLFSISVSVSDSATDAVAASLCALSCPFNFRVGVSILFSSAARRRCRHCKQTVGRGRDV